MSTETLYYDRRGTRYALRVLDLEGYELWVHVHGGWLPGGEFTSRRDLPEHARRAWSEAHNA